MPPKESLKQRTIRGFFWSLVERWGRYVLTIATLLILARLLAAEDFGVVALALACLSFFELVMNQGIKAALIQRKDLTDAHYDTAFWVAAAYGVGSAALLLLGGDALARLMGQPRLGEVMPWLAVIAVVNGLSVVQQARLMRTMDFRSLALRSTAGSALGGIAGVGAALAGFGIWALVAQQLINAFSSLAVLWTATGWRPRLAFSPRRARELGGYGRWVSAVAFINHVLNRGDVLFIGAALGAHAVGLYSVGRRIMQMFVDLVTTAMTQAAGPAFAKLQSEPARLAAAYAASVRVSATVMLPAFFGTAAVAPDLVPWMLGERWTPAVPMVQCFAVIGALQSVGYFNFSVAYALGKPEGALRVTLIYAVTNVAAILLALPFGVLAVTLAITLRNLVTYPLSVRLALRLVPLTARAYALNLLPSFVSASVMTAAVLAVGQALDPAMTTAARLAIQVAAGAVVYAAVFVCFGRGGVTELVGLARTLAGRDRRAGAGAR